MSRRAATRIGIYQANTLWVMSGSGQMCLLVTTAKRVHREKWLLVRIPEGLIGRRRLIEDQNVKSEGRGFESALQRKILSLTLR